MTEYLVDTNIISEITKPQPNQAVIDWLCENSNELRLSTITVMELNYGVLRMTDGKRKIRLSAAIGNIVDLYRDDIFNFDARAAIICARLRAHARSQGVVPGTEDSMIAAIALANDFVLATRNTADFESFGVRLFNPFEVE